PHGDGLARGRQVSPAVPARSPRRFPSPATLIGNTGGETRERFTHRRHPRVLGRPRGGNLRRRVRAAPGPGRDRSILVQAPHRAEVVMQLVLMVVLLIVLALTSTWFGVDSRDTADRRNPGPGVRPR